MHSTTASCLAIALAALAAGSAAPAPAWAKDASGKKPNPANAPAQVGSVDASGVYRMSAEELTYDCKRLTGRMRIRLLEVRDYNNTKPTSSISQQMRSATKPVVGVMLGKAQEYETDPVKRHADDIAMLRAYNAQLAAKNCKALDLDAEIAGKK